MAGEGNYELVANMQKECGGSEWDEEGEMGEGIPCDCFVLKTTFKIEISFEGYLLCIARVGNKWVQLKDGQIAHQYRSD